ncbi:carcinine transporter-like [Leguminivora glycinivorella]|uniref:carcinine transporter-like n=1 Tax=Leguminivora glycinivorella TaxID=1035111 RepID=UPI00200D1508|nr:carcinine transporter-like [Leguminivora glycinivorella]XP_047997893.1 carcinine transporter-like [Leguminivora glycinivorella]
MQKMETRGGRRRPTLSDIKENESEDVTYDDLLSSAGEFGLYQKILFISTFPFYAFGVVSYFQQLFITEVSPNHWCNVPELANLTALQRRALAIPADTDARFGYSQCSAYVANWSAELVAGRTAPDPSWRTEPCRHGWEFNSTEIPYPTITSELGWVCDKDSYQASAQSIFFVGSIVGGFLIGWIADRYGRLPAAAVCNVIGGVSGVITIFAKNFVQFAVCRFFMGMSWDNSMLMVYLLVLEYVAPKYRTIIANLPFAIFYTIAVCVYPWIALACNDWKLFSLATCIPMIFAVFAPLLMPESPRWLMSVGRVDDAIIKIQRIGQVNKKEVPSKLIEQFKASLSKQKVDAKYGAVDLIKRRLLRNMFICVCMGYMCCTITFDSLIRSIGQLEFDFFVSFSVISFTEFPSLVLVSFILDLTGRKWLAVSTFAIACVFSVLTAFLGGGLSSVLCAVVARFAINITCNTVMQWATEMLPTAVRGTGMSIVHICGYIATVISPFIVYLEIYYTWLPLVIVGAVAGSGILIVIGLPETAAKQLPHTFEDAETLIRTSKFIEIPCLMKKKNDAEGHENSSFEL